MSDFSYEIKKKLGVLSTSTDKNGGEFTTEVNMISYGGKEAKLDIRKWDRRTEEGKMLKGIVLGDDEARGLYEILKGVYGNE